MFFMNRSCDYVQENIDYFSHSSKVEKRYTWIKVYLIAFMCIKSDHISINDCLQKRFLPNFSPQNYTGQQHRSSEHQWTMSTIKPRDTVNNNVNYNPFRLIPTHGTLLPSHVIPIL